MMIKKISSSLSLILLTIIAYGQSYDFKAQLNPVEEEDYYQVVLSPQLLGKLNNRSADLRLTDSKGTEVPYAVYTDRTRKYISSFKEYEIIAREDIADGISYLVFSNPDKQAIDNVSIIVRNNALTKKIRLSGSEDKDKWFAITDYQILNSMASSDTTSELQIIDFPLSNYEFFKLEIDNEDQLPIDFRALGYYDRSILEAEKTFIDCPVEYETDSLKSSFIKINFGEAVYLEKLNFDINSEEFYSRKGRISVKNIREDRKGRRIESFDMVGYINLGSDRSNEVDLGGISEQELFIEIENDDNAPLTINSINASVFNKYLVARLKANESYNLYFGNAATTAPRYDIQEFVSEVSIRPVILKHGPIETLGEPVIAEPKSEGIFDNPIVLWSIIIGVGILFAGVSINMVRNMSRKTDDEN